MDVRESALLKENAGTPLTEAEEGRAGIDRLKSPAGMQMQEISMQEISVDGSQRK